MARVDSARSARRAVRCTGAGTCDWSVVRTDRPWSKEACALSCKEPQLAREGGPHFSLTVCAGARSSPPSQPARFSSLVVTRSSSKLHPQNLPSQSPSATTRPATSEKKPSAVRSRFSESIPTTRFDIDRPQSPARSRWRSECRRTSVCVSLLAISRESPQTRPPINPIAQTTKLDFPSIGIDRLFDISAPGPYLASRAVSQGAKKAVRPCLCPTSPLPSSPIVVFRQRS